MKVEKISLIITLVLIVAFIFAGVSYVFAADEKEEISFNTINSNNTNTNTNVNQNKANLIEVGNNSTTIKVNANKNPNELAHTGTGDLPWVIMGICAVSAIFAFKKVKEYKEN